MSVGRGAGRGKAPPLFYEEAEGVEIAKYNREMCVFLFGDADFNPDRQVHAIVADQSQGINEISVIGYSSPAITSGRHCFNLNANHKTVLVISSCALVPVYQLFRYCHRYFATTVRFRFGN